MMEYAMEIMLQNSSARRGLCQMHDFSHSFGRIHYRAILLRSVNNLSSKVNDRQLDGVTLGPVDDLKALTGI